MPLACSITLTCQERKVSDTDTVSVYFTLLYLKAVVILSDIDKVHERTSARHTFSPVSAVNAEWKAKGRDNIHKTVNAVK